jgi:uroporphyrin-III C-methyltransferase
MKQAPVTFVGAGPGAADLLTLRAVRALEQADVVLHDALVSEEILALAPQARLIAVGKRAHRQSTAQGFINRTLVDCARRYRSTVRLKGGDPGVFGRLDEETSALRAAGIDFEIVPGISAAFAAAAELGASLTLRGVARAVTLVTPSIGEGEGDADAWANVARAHSGGATLAIYMAGRRIVATAQRLVALGLAPATPFVVMENVSLPERRSWRGTLEQALSADCGIGDGPVVLLVGDALVSALHEAALEPQQVALAA